MSFIHCRLSGAEYFRCDEHVGNGFFAGLTGSDEEGSVSVGNACLLSLSAVFTVRKDTVDAFGKVVIFAQGMEAGQ